MTVKLDDLVGAVDTFELSLKLASLVGDEQAQDAIKKALKDVNSKIVEGIKNETDDTPDGNDADQTEEQPQAAEDEGEKTEATEDDTDNKEPTEDDGGEKEVTEDDSKPAEDTEQEQLNA